MKKLLFILLLLPFISKAQTKMAPATTGNTVKFKTTVNSSPNTTPSTAVPSTPAPATPVPSTPVNPSPNDGLNPDQRRWLAEWKDYYLENVKVTIHTGNDNKELPSNVIIGLFRLGGDWGDAPNSLGQLYNSNAYTLNKQEFKTNSTTDFNLRSNYVKPTARIYNDYNGYRWFALGLRMIEQFGLELHINYMPNFFADAWKVERVTMTVQFKDILGRPHPTLGNKEIVFSQSKLLTDKNSTLVLKTNGLLFPQL